jgi:hypothetical protein
MRVERLLFEQISERVERVADRVAKLRPVAAVSPSYAPGCLRCVHAIHLCHAAQITVADTNASTQIVHSSSPGSWDRLRRLFM